MRGNESEGYDVYDLYDLGEFDQKGSVSTKYGTFGSYASAVQKARASGMAVYVDIVLNHMGGGEKTEWVKVREVNPDNRLEFIAPEEKVEAYTVFEFPGRGGKYSRFKWNKDCFTGIDHAVNRTGNGILKILNAYGPQWNTLSDTEKGNYDYLMLNDIETRNPAVRQELKNWISWYYSKLPFDGLRLDAVKHISPEFFNDWIDYVKAEIPQDVFIVGEYWLSDKLPVLLKYLDDTGNRMHLFDAPLHHNFSTASVLRETFDLRSIFNDTLLSMRPDKAVTFVDNHDTQPLQALEEATEQWFKPHAYALILLREAGYPFVFYPDLFGSCYSGKNKDGIHQDTDLRPLPELSEMLIARDTIAYGTQEDYFDDPHCIGWVRKGSPDRPDSGCAVLLSNHPSEVLIKKMSLGKKFSGTVFLDLLDKAGSRIHLDTNGEADFFVPPCSVSIWCLAARETAVYTPAPMPTYTYRL